MRTVGAYEAKTHLASLLQATARGERITITKHGQPVAMLIPPEAPRLPDVSDVIRGLRAARRGVTLGGAGLRDLIEEGRA